MAEILTDAQRGPRGPTLLVPLEMQLPHRRLKDGSLLEALVRRGNCGRLWPQPGTGMTRGSSALPILRRQGELTAEP